MPDAIPAILSSSSDSAPTRDCPEPTMSVSGNLVDQSKLSQIEAEELESNLLEQLWKLEDHAQRLCFESYALVEAVGWESLRETIRAAKRTGSELTVQDANWDLSDNSRVNVLNKAAEAFDDASTSIGKAIQSIRLGDCQGATTEVQIAKTKAEKADTAASVAREAVQRTRALQYVQDIERHAGEDAKALLHIPDLETEATKGVAAKGLTELLNTSIELPADLEIVMGKLRRLVNA